MTSPPRGEPTEHFEGGSMARNWWRWRWPALVAAVTLVAPVARADNFDLYGYGPRGAAMGGALTAEANDYTAVFYNPALLVNTQDVNFGFHFQWYRMQADVHPKDLAQTLDCSKCQAPDSVGYSVGLLVPLAGKVKNHLALGVGVYLPSTVMLRLAAPDTTTPFWYHYNSNPERIVIHAGAGIKITDWLNLGLGIQALADLQGDGATVQVDLFSKQVTQRSIDSNLSTRVGPVFGVNLKPTSKLRLGATFKWEMKLLYRIPASVDLTGVGRLDFAVTGVAHYSPHTLTFGAAYDITDNFTVSLDGEWQNWSAAPSPYVNLSIALTGATLNALGLDTAFNINSPNQPPGFSDTFGGRLGMEWRLSERFAARAGGFLRPTPVPKQNVSGTNLLDNTTIGAAVGVGFNFPDPLEIFASPIKIDLAGQMHVILPRDATKDSTDTVPSYTASAKVFGVTAALRYDF